VRPNQAGTKLNRTQTAAGLLWFAERNLLHSVMRTYKKPQKLMQNRAWQSILELVVFLAPPLRPDADRPCALQLAGAASTDELM